MRCPRRAALTSDASRLPSESGDRAKRCLSEGLSLSTHPLPPAERCVGDGPDARTSKNFVSDPHDRVKLFRWLTKHDLAGRCGTPATMPPPAHPKTKDWASDLGGRSKLAEVQLPHADAIFFLPCRQKPWALGRAFILGNGPAALLRNVQEAATQNIAHSHSG